MTASAAQTDFQPPMKEVDKVLGFYGLKEQPFGVTPDARFLFLSDSHKEALASLLYAIETRRGFSALVAEPGMGKTTLLFRILNDIKGHARTAFVFQPECSPPEFMRNVLDDLGIPFENQAEASLHKLLNEALLSEMRAGKRFVLVVDEAQSLDDSVLESIRLLSNFETPQAKLMHIVLAGQPQLADRLARPELCQLRQRVSAISWLKPLSQLDTLEYISHRVRLGGRCERPLFTRSAVEEIASCSQGIPRNINNVCFLSLSLGFAKQERVIDFETVREATEDAGLADPARPGPRALWPLPSEPKSQHPVHELQFHPPVFAPRQALEDVDEELMRFRSAPHEGTFLKLVLIAMGFVVVPLLAIVLLGNRQIEDNLADLINGSGPPDASIVSRPVVLRPPSAPYIEKLGTASTDSPAADVPSDADSESNGASATDDGENSSPPPTASARKRETQPRDIRHGPQMIRVDRQQTLFELALEHYGKSNWTIVEQICIANPSLHGPYAVVHPGQRVLLPDLSPKYPLLSADGSPAMINARQVSRYQP
jgi:general secretion pathway protein A